MPKGIPDKMPDRNCYGISKYCNPVEQDCSNTKVSWFEHGINQCRQIIPHLIFATGSLMISFPSAAFAQTANSDSINLINAANPSGLIEILAQISVGSSEVMLLALFGGAMSFAMMAAFWLIRERNRVTDENRQLRQSLSNYKATNERNEALVNVADQRVVLWNATERAPIVLGSLSTACGAPDSKTEFLGFGKWITGASCETFEKALLDLRQRAVAFDMALQTRGGGVIEAQGRTSGAYAFVRFIELSGERAAFAHLEAEHTGLLATFDSIQNLFDRLDMQVWLSKKDGSLYWANEAYAKAVDAVDTVAVINNDARLFDRVEREKIQAGIKVNKCFSGQLPAIICGDRKIVDVLEVTSENGGAGIAVDKSAIEKVRNTLNQTIASHATTLDQLTTPIAIFDAEKNLQFHNSSFQQLWKLNPDFLESKPSNADILGAMREAKRLPPYPDWRIWRDGQLEIYQALETRIDWWHLPDGKTLRVVVSPQALGGATWIFEDVTKELELKSSYNSLVRVQGETLDHLSEAIAVFSSDGILRLSNPALWKMLRVESSDIEPGTHISVLTELLTGKFLSPDIWDDIVGNITGFDDERSTKVGRLYLEDGKIIEFSLVPLPDGRTMVTFLDVTANVNIELALTERNEALEEAGNLKNQFLKHVSYELRTPLTTISGFGELLSMRQTGKLNAVQNDYLNHINTSSSVLKAIIDDILDLATIDAGAMELELQKFELEPAISNVVNKLSAILKENHVTVDTNVNSAARHLIADSTRFRQIIYNLISNAIKHSPDGGKIDVQCSAENNSILISVSDQGPGVPANERRLIFSRFESSTSGNSRKGAGLGLSIVKSFMELHDGSVHVESAESRGAKFVCTFPAKPDEFREAAQ
ncbi:MAG: alkaline phosphatase [Hyphomicrobiales bacterium]|nr:alkaline phosphatase [Hyphomicrobiales bacterium]